MLSLFLSLLLIFSPFFSRECSSQPLAPAFYVFGDSLLDAGNNVRASYRPYGINFPYASTGRFTNGKTFADIIAGYLGLPFPPPYRAIPRSQKGYIYASGGCGILPETGSHLGCWDLDAQLSLFKKTIIEELMPIFPFPTELSQHLANSMFLVWTGSNDYLLNYFNDPNPAYDPQQFAQLLNEKLSNQLKTLYDLGARKVLVLDMPPFGCLPVYRKNGGHNETWCDDGKNKNAAMFNEGLALTIQTLTTTYPDSHFTLGKVYDITNDAFNNPGKYGLTNVHDSSCETMVVGNILCVPLEPWQCPGVNPREYLYFDGVHPTEATFEVLANICFYGSNVCVPNNIQQLVQLNTNSAILRSAVAA